MASDRSRGSSYSEACKQENRCELHPRPRIDRGSHLLPQERLPRRSSSLLRKRDGMRRDGISLSHLTADGRNKNHRSRVKMRTRITDREESSLEAFGDFEHQRTRISRYSLRPPLLRRAKPRRWARPKVVSELYGCLFPGETDPTVTDPLHPRPPACKCKTALAAAGTCERNSDRLHFVLNRTSRPPRILGSADGFAPAQRCCPDKCGYNGSALPPIFWYAASTDPQASETGR